jgi:hypothetical protein
VVRVHAGALGLRGERLTVVGQRGDTLLVQGRRPPGGRLPLSRVDALDVRTGRSRPAGARRGAVIGLAAGAAPTLALLALAVREDSRCDGCYVPATLVVGVLGAGFTAITTGVGAVVGYQRPRDRWAAVSPWRVGVGPAAGGGGRVAVRLRF